MRLRFNSDYNSIIIFNDSLIYHFLPIFLRFSSLLFSSL